MGRLSRIVLPGLIILALYYAFFGGQFSVFELGGARRDVSEAAEELRRLQHENDSLREWADSLGSDLDVLERFARERYGMIREGEVLYRIPNGEGGLPSDTLGGGG